MLSTLSTVSRALKIALAFAIGIHPFGKSSKVTKYSVFSAFTNGA
jgi:hypothetical protein